MRSISNLLGRELKRLRRLTATTYTLGYVEGVRGARIHGWAFTPTEPDRRVRLRVLVDSRFVAEVVAEGYRPDLQAEGYGDGCHGFTIHVPPHLADSLEHAVSVVDARTGLPLVALSMRHKLDLQSPASAELTQLLFDAVFYHRQAGDVREPLDHYRSVGWKRGFMPHPLLDTDWYVRRHGLEGLEDPLSHYERVGAKAGLPTHPLMEAGKATREGGGASVVPLVAYLRGEIEGSKEISSFFSDCDYAARYPGVVEAGFLPIVHYLTFGWKERLRPHVDFDPDLFGRLADLSRGVEPYSHFVSDLVDGVSVPAPVAPEVSIIILNYNKALLTLQCLYFLRRFTDARRVEVIVVDNGSEARDFQLLSRYARDVRIIQLHVNRGFGEGNNIGVEHALGRQLVFLNNDVFVCEGWLGALLQVVEDDPTVGAVGGKLLFPDGSLQEAGAMISVCGTALQRGKHLPAHSHLFNRVEAVDYCSAALLLVRAESFRSVLGFDLCWDPAYYEDSDLCLKLRAIGQRTAYAPDCRAVHLEHATAEVPGVAATLQDVVPINRLKFVNRWSEEGAFTDSRWDPEVVVRTRTPARGRGGSLALYSPYPLTPGGGERYLLTMAATFGKGRRCILFTPDRYSRIRLLTVARELKLDLDHLELDEFARAGLHERFDTFVCMGNEALPPVPGIGRLNVFHCQFPFPMDAEQTQDRWRALDTYDGVVVNSRFTADHYDLAVQRLGLKPPRIVVVPPPVPQVDGLAGFERAREPLVILSVGRFAPDGHCKCQDAMVQALARLARRVSTPIELHLAGTIGSGAKGRSYLRELIERARGHPVHFHPDVGISKLSELYRNASLYWHLTGSGQDVSIHPERFEHFGISIVEAMSAGAVPLALGHGGPAEVIEDGVSGELLAESQDIVERSERLLSHPARLLRMSQAARVRARDFSPERFGHDLEAALASFSARGAQSLVAAE